MLLRVFFSVAICTVMMGRAAAEILTASSFLPPQHAFTQMLYQWSDELKKLTNGDLSLNVYPAGQLGPASRQFDLVSSGAVDIAIVLHSATPGRFPLTHLASLPLTYPSAGQDSAITSKRLTELSSKYLAKEHPNTHILWMVVTPPLKILTKTKVTSVEDLKGLRIRYAGKVFQEILQLAKASPMPVSPNNTADSLSKGIIDGAAFPYEAAKAFDLAPSVKYSFEPGLASATFAVLINKKVYDNLSARDKRAIDQTSGPMRAEEFGKTLDNAELEGRKYLLSNGIKITTLNNSQLNGFKELVTPIIKNTLDQTSKKYPDAKAFFDLYTK